MLAQCCHTAYDVGSTLDQHWVYVSSCWDIRHWCVHYMYIYPRVSRVTSGSIFPICLHSVVLYFPCLRHPQNRGFSRVQLQGPGIACRCVLSMSGSPWATWRRPRIIAHGVSDASADFVPLSISALAGSSCTGNKGLLWAQSFLPIWVYVESWRDVIDCRLWCASGFMMGVKWWPDIYVLFISWKNIAAWKPKRCKSHSEEWHTCIPSKHKTFV